MSDQQTGGAMPYAPGALPPRTYTLSTPEPVLTPREAAARRLLALGALKKVLDEEIARTRTTDGAAFTMAGQREPAALPDGTPLGNVRADKGSEAGWAVTDPGKLRAWVEAAHPEQIVERVTTVVDPEYVEAMLDNLRRGHRGEACEWYDPETGEVLDVLPGVTYVGPGKPKLVVTPDKAAPAAVRAYLAPVLAALEVGP